MEKEYKFIMTESVEKIINQIQRVVSKDEWMAVFGGFGTGKTEMKNYLISGWSRKTDNVVIQFPTFESSNSRIGHIMTWMLRQLNPGEHVPANVELKAEKLRTTLMRARNQKRKVILILEDVGSIHIKTFKELKKIHELTGLGEKNLFSILMFGNESRTTFSVLASPEIGLRCKISKMENPVISQNFGFANRIFPLLSQMLTIMDSFNP